MENMLPQAWEGFDNKGNGEFFSISAHPLAFAMREHFCISKFGKEYFAKQCFQKQSCSNPLLKN